MRSLTLLQRLLRALAIGGLALGISFAGAGGTYALWNANAVASTSTIASGSAAITTTPLTGASVALFPGSTSYQTAVITNSGTVPLALQAQSLVLTSVSTDFATAIRVSVGVVATAAACNSTFTPVWTGAIGSLPVTSLAATVPTIATATICIAVLLPALASATTQITTVATFALTIGGVQLS